VEARNPAVLITEFRPNRMPSRLTTNTWPLEVMLPRISEGPSPPVTRLSTTAELLGSMNLTLPPAPTLKVFQLTIAKFEVWLTTTEAVPCPVMVAEPPTTVPPCGPWASEGAAIASSASAQICAPTSLSAFAERGAAPWRLLPGYVV